MIYQQEIKETNDFYLKYKDKIIVYSKQLSNDIGQIQTDTRIKIGSEIIQGILISSTMENQVLMAKLNDTLKQKIYDANTGKIIGKVTKRIDESDGQCHTTPLFSMSDQSPRFSYSIHVLKNLINF